MNWVFRLYMSMIVEQGFSYFFAVCSPPLKVQMSPTCGLKYLKDTHIYIIFDLYLHTHTHIDMCMHLYTHIIYLYISIYIYKIKFNPSLDIYINIYRLYIYIYRKLTNNLPQPSTKNIKPDVDDGTGEGELNRIHC